ncbi:hypothetical protein [Paenibacillus sp. NPDC058071]|uniref:hypothetical protein n=1 Tax=Paenibacillus sp. NPDC058071 TaxID=3346326 RepID=UPI0036DA177B
MTDPIIHTPYAAAHHRKAADVLPFIDRYISKKEQEIAEIEQMVERYETRRMKEERAYQSMSTLRRLLAGKKPDHHLAVEYIHFVKKPMEKVRELRQEIENVRSIQQSAGLNDIISVSSDLASELNG